MDDLAQRKVILELLGVGLAAFKANASTAVALKLLGHHASDSVRAAILEESDALQAHNKELYAGLEAVIKLMDEDRRSREDGK